jgi:hypothetical protein
MAVNLPSGYAAGVQDDALPMFEVQRVQMKFDISADFVAAQVADNVLVLALSTGRILRFDLDNAKDIDDIDLPKRPAEVGLIRKLFLDPSASHLIISTTLGENYYLHTQSRQPKILHKLKGVVIESVGWNASQPTASTREILIGSADGNVYETSIEPSTEFYKSSEKYVRNVWQAQEGGAIVGIYADVVVSKPETRRVLVATQHKLYHFVGRTGGRGYESGGSIYAKLFETEAPTTQEVDRTTGVSPSLLAVSPDAVDDVAERAYAWLHPQGIYHGNLISSAPDLVTLGKQVFRDSKTFQQSQLPPGGRSRAISSLLLTHFHMVVLVDGRLTGINRLDGTVVYNQQILDPGQTCLGLFTDHQKNTYWMFTPQEIFEIVVSDEARDVWSIMLQQGQYEAAQRYAKTPQQRDVVASMTGDHLISQGKFAEAAAILGKSTKAFEDVALTFIDKGEHDALRKYLSVKLGTLRKSNQMQRVMLASWMVELYMSKLNQLDDNLSTRAELTSSVSGLGSADLEKQLPALRREFQEFVTKQKPDLDRTTTYEIISAHGREEELLFFANVVEDYNYVLSYWINRERWQEAMAVLKKQTDPEIFYRYSTVLMSHVATELVEVLMRQTGLDIKKMIPALLTYNKVVGDGLPLQQNQAIRFLQFCINHSHSIEPAVHNTLISMHAAHPTKDESGLLAYLETQHSNHDQFYDADFALRLCITHKRVRSAVHVYSTMEQYASAVDLALKHDEVDLAADVADRPGIDQVLRKKLWLKVAKKVIGQNKSIKSAIDFLKRCELLRIEDLIPFFPDFVVIDDFKEEICAALEDYSRQIDELKREMDESANTAQHIKEDIQALDQRYAIVEPGERCWKCRLPLLMRQFFVFPCQHAFHADCLGEMVMRMAGMGRGKRIRELQREIGRGVALGKRREGMVKELDGLVAGAWYVMLPLSFFLSFFLLSSPPSPLTDRSILCSEMAVKQIDEPFITASDDVREWAV